MINAFLMMGLSALVSGVTTWCLVRRKRTTTATPVSPPTEPAKPKEPAPEPFEPHIGISGKWVVLDLVPRHLVGMITINPAGARNLAGRLLQIAELVEPHKPPEAESFSEARKRADNLVSNAESGAQ